MKNVFVLLLMIIGSIQMFGQTEILGYVPMRTYHFNRSETLMNQYHPTEGGNIGFVLVQRTYKEDWFRDFQAGYVKNSYHDNSVILQFGMGIKTKLVNISGNIGLATGYKKQYIHYREIHGITVNDTGNLSFGFKGYSEEENKTLSFLPGIFSNNGILPITMVTFTFNVNKYVNPTINISPGFINGGVMIKIK